LFCCEVGFGFWGLFFLCFFIYFFFCFALVDFLALFGFVVLTLAPFGMATVSLDFSLKIRKKRKAGMQQHPWHP